jgi:hypothetical protein
MQTWLKDNGSRLAVLAAVFTALFTAFHLFVVSPTEVVSPPWRPCLPLHHGPAPVRRQSGPQALRRPQN